MYSPSLLSKLLVSNTDLQKLIFGAMCYLKWINSLYIMMIYTKHALGATVTTVECRLQSYNHHTNLRLCKHE